MAVFVAVFAAAAGGPGTVVAQDDETTGEAIEVMYAAVQHMIQQADVPASAVVLDSRFIPLMRAPESGEAAFGILHTPLPFSDSTLTRVVGDLPVQVRELNAALDCGGRPTRCTLRPGVSLYLIVSQPRIEGDRAELYIEQREVAPEQSRTGTYLVGWLLTLERSGCDWSVVDGFVDVRS